ncbi:MAG: hypothetical protein AAF434_16410 [Pseudomonadota bacterium]
MSTSEFNLVAAKLPSSLLRQHATRFTEGAITLEDYRQKRAQILRNILTMHASVSVPRSVPPLLSDTNFGTIRTQRKKTSSNHALTPSHVILVSVLSFTAAVMSLLPNARTTIAALTSTLALTVPSSATAESTQNSSELSNEFQKEAQKMAEKKKWSEDDIAQILSVWEKLTNEQQYSARRYQGYNSLLVSSVERATELRELAEVSTLQASLEAQANQIDRISDALR